jgi:hypothetical protein
MRLLPRARSTQPSSPELAHTAVPWRLWAALPIQTGRHLSFALSGRTVRSGYMGYRSYLRHSDTFGSNVVVRTLNDQALCQKRRTVLHKLNLDSMGNWVDCRGKSLDIDMSAKRSMPIQPPPTKVARSHQIETMIVSCALINVSYQMRCGRGSSQRWLRLSMIVISEIPIAVVVVFPMVASVAIVLCGNDDAAGEQCAKQSKCQKPPHPYLPNELGSESAARVTFDAATRLQHLAKREGAQSAQHLLARRCTTEST